MLHIGCSKSNKSVKVMSNAIIWFQRIKFKILGIEAMGISHIYGKFVGSSWNRDFIYHQHGSGSSFMGEKNFKAQHQTVKELRLNISKDAEIKIGQVCIDREGTPYSFMQNIGIGIVGLIWIITFQKVVIKNPFTKNTNCIEEWVDILCNELALTKPSGVDSWLPQDFWMWLESLPCVEEI
jgi:hypothetical protein